MEGPSNPFRRLPAEVFDFSMLLVKEEELSADFLCDLQARPTYSLFPRRRCRSLKFHFCVHICGVPSAALALIDLAQAV